jgi:SAM-dependent methyltransferase
MKTRTPYDRDNLKINKSDYVLEVGSGHNPMYRSDIIVEKFVSSNYHRCGDVKVYPHQKLINADGAKMPFKNKEFDYDICNQVLEHTDDPAKFLNEQCRVAKNGYIETPSILGEFLFPKKSHKWVILDIDNKLVLFEKNKMPGNYMNNYGELFLNYLPYQSLMYKLLWLTEGDLFLNRYEWKDNIDFIINPTDEKYLAYFTKPWNREMVQKLFPNRGLFKELKKLLCAVCYLLENKINSKMHKRVLINYL